MNHFLHYSKQLLFAFALMLLAGQPCAAFQGLDLLKKVMEHSPDSEIHSGEFEFELTIQEKVLSVEQLQKSARDAKKRFEKILERRPDLKTKVGDQLEGFEARYIAKKRALSTRQLRYVYVHRGPSNGGDRFVQFSRFDKEKGEFDKPNQLVFRGGSANNILKQPATRMTIVGDIPFFVCKDPQLLGRGVVGWLNGVPPEQLGESVGNVTQVPIAGVYEQAAWELIFTRPSNSGEVEIRCHVIPERGYIVPLLTESLGGKVIREWKSDGYFQPKGSDIWFPRNSKCTIWSPKSGLVDQIETYKFDTASVQLNHRISDERFSVAVPKGSVVLDSRVSPAVNYVSNKQVSLTIEDMDDLASNEELSKFEGQEN